jgi:hypothetical protein
MRRALAVLAAAAVLVALPACGKTNEQARAAGLVPAKAIAYVTVSLAPSLDQRRNLVALAGRFPKLHAKQTFEGLKDQALAAAVKQLHLDYATEVKPWLGTELALAVLSGVPQPTVVGLVHVRSGQEKAAQATMAKVAARPNADVLYRLVGEYMVVTDKKAGVAPLDQVQDQAKHPESALASQDKFKSVVDKVHGERIVLGWYDAHAITDAIKADTSDPRLRNFDFSDLIGSSVGAIDLHVTSKAVVLQGAGTRAPIGSSVSGEPRLTNGLPASTLAELTVFDVAGIFNRVTRLVDQLRPGLDVRAQVQQATGIDLQTDVLSWMHGESVLVAGPAPSGTVPLFALLVAPSDHAKAAAGIDKIRSIIESRLKLHLAQRPVAGGTMYMVPVRLPYDLQPAMALLGDRFVLASTPEYLTTLATSSGTSFSSTSEYRNTLGSSDPHTTSELVLRLGGIRQYVENLLTGKKREVYDREVAPWVKALDAFALRTTNGPDGTHFLAELSVG